MTDPKQPARPVMYYDGGCPLCSREVAHYRRLDRSAAIEWIDISRDPAAVENAGIPIDAAMAVLHARDRDGRLQRGAYAFAALWRELPYYRWLARLVALPGVLPVLDRAYRRFARWRLNRRCDAGGCRT